MAAKRRLANAEFERDEEMECTCDLRTKVVGDGCEICNPEKALELAKEVLAEVQAAVLGYYADLDQRKHGDLAMHRAFAKIQDSLGMQWVCGDSLKTPNVK